MRFRYTATRGINTPNPVKAFDTTPGTVPNGAGFNMVDNSLERTDPMVFSVKYCNTDVPATWQFLFGIRDVVSVYIAINNGQLRVYDDVGADSTFNSMVSAFGVEHQITFESDGATDYSITLDGETRSSTQTLLTQQTTELNIGNSVQWNSHGVFYDARLWVDGVLSHHWPMHDGSGTTARDIVGGLNLPITDAGAAGWTEYNAPHVIGQQYLLNVPIKDYNRSIDTDRKTVVAIGGFKQTTFLRTDTEYTFKTAPLTGHEARDFREFLDSCQAGERFEVDTGETPTVWKQFTLSSAGYAESRDIRRGGGGFADYFSFGFTANEG